MIEDSLELQKRVRWFTSMVGQKKSLKAVMAKAKQAGAVRALCPPPTLQFEPVSLRFGLCTFQL
eukprot:3594378-Rhodomonas_salina.2